MTWFDSIRINYHKMISFHCCFHYFTVPPYQRNDFQTNSFVSANFSAHILCAHNRNNVTSLFKELYLWSASWLSWISTTALWIKKKKHQHAFLNSIFVVLESKIRLNIVRMTFANAISNLFKQLHFEWIQFSVVLFTKHFWFWNGGYELYWRSACSIVRPTMGDTLSNERWQVNCTNWNTIWRSHFAHSEAENITEINMGFVHFSLFLNSITNIIINTNTFLHISLTQI